MSNRDPNSPDSEVLLELGVPQPDGRLRLEGRQAIRRASTELARQARRELVIFSRDLDPRYYDDQPFLGEIQRLALERPQLPVRALVMEPRAPISQGHRLIELARRLSSRIQIRKVGADDRDRIDAFLVADRRGYCLRPLADQREAFHAPDSPAEARRLCADFERMWELAEPDTELRRLHL